MGKSQTKISFTFEITYSGAPLLSPMALTLQIHAEQQSNTQQEIHSDQQGHHVILGFNHGQLFDRSRKTGIPLYLVQY